MKTYHVVTLFPELVQAHCAHGVLGQAQKNQLIKVQTHNPRLHTSDVHKTVDDRPFGGGDGMLMLIEPLEKTVKAISQKGRVIHLSPQGALFNDKKARELAELEVFTLICGRYAGIDQRFLNEYVQEEISIGDYVLSGGELAAAVIIDACARFVPGVLGHGDSAMKDSLTSGMLEAPAFTRPREWNGHEVPEVLLSGHHVNIEEWKLFVGILTTLMKRPETLQVKLTPKQAEKIRQFAQSLSERERYILGLGDFHMDRLIAWLEK